MKLVSEKEVNGYIVKTESWEDFTIVSRRRIGLPDTAEFTLLEVTKNNVTWWSASDAKALHGTPRIGMFEGEAVVYLTTFRALHHLFPIQDLPRYRKVKGELIGGRSIKDLINLKRAIAEELKLQPTWTEREAGMIEDLVKVELAAKQKAKAEAQRAAREAQEKQRLERDAKRYIIVRRKRITGYTGAGGRRYGIPVVGDEWKLLHGGAYCVSVASYDDATATAGAYIEAFEVKKERGVLEQKNVAAITPTNPLEKEQVFDSAVLRRIVIKGELEEVLQVSSIKAVQEMNKAGLNSGTLVMCPKEGESGRFSVFRLSEGMMESVTEVKHR